jgi:hypothetical protein
MAKRHGAKCDLISASNARLPRDDDFDVLSNASPVGTPWMWTLAFGHHEDRTPTHGYEATREGPWRRSLKAGGGIRANGEVARTSHEEAETADRGTGPCNRHKATSKN